MVEVWEEFVVNKAVLFGKEREMYYFCIKKITV